ncbi:MAG: Stk1 family PASTA domain-containing Ser/Thr kinase [Actinomycetota bacterium]|nr:Stk1 family PASTA domain-containing Ser/Thr kinase [Actinomycetota bacterium]
MKEAALIGKRYRLDELLAEGGMGEVWRAHDELLDRPVAVKILRRSLSADPLVAERFRREARAAASLSHPNMANVYDYVEEADAPGIVMELVEGQTLADCIAEKAPMDVTEAVTLIDQVLDALDAAHATGVVHRDVKPPNVMIGADGRAKVTDFGIARALGESTLTETGTVLGSVHYVAPEQLHGGGAAPPGDLYATGVILYEMLTGKRPFEGETPVAIAMSRLSKDPISPRAWRKDLSPAMEAAIMRALERNPVDRYATAMEMRAAIDTAATGRPPAKPEPAAKMDGTMILPAAALPADATTQLDAGATTQLRPQAERNQRTHKPLFARKAVRAGLFILAAVLAVLAVGAMFRSRTPARVHVPTFDRLAYADAQKLAEKNHLEVRVTRRVQNGARPGTVLSQTIAAGTVVKSHTTIPLVLSLGPPECCKIPDLDGMTIDEAQSALTRAGLALGDVSFAESEKATGTVIDQSPNAGTFQSRGEKVDIVVDKAPPAKKKRGKGGHD